MIILQQEKLDQYSKKNIKFEETAKSYNREIFEKNQNEL